jgi:DNA-binding transcriptional LysR family regulator
MNDGGTGVQNLNDLYLFAQVVEHRGFAPAGRALAMPKSKLSRRVAVLEERLGVRLIQRSTRRFSVTDIGQDYYRHCKAMLIEAEAAQDAIDLARSGPQGVVRMTCPVALLHARIGVMLAEFMVANPKVTVYLEATNRRVDVIDEGIDVAIRARPPPLESSELRLRVLAERSWRLVTAPTLLQRLGAPQVPADLARYPSLDLGPPQREHVWELQGPSGARAEIPHEPRLVTDDMIALRTAAMAGIGVVQLPAMVMIDELRQGKLVPLLSEWTLALGIVHVVFPTRRGLLPSVRALIDFLAERFAELDEE